MARESGGNSVLRQEDAEKRMQRKVEACGDENLEAQRRKCFGLWKFEGTKT